VVGTTNILIYSLIKFYLCDFFCTEVCSRSNHLWWLCILSTRCGVDVCATVDFTKLFFFLPFLACLHDQNKNGFFRGPAFIQPIRAICKVFKKP